MRISMHISVRMPMGMPIRMVMHITSPKEAPWDAVGRLAQKPVVRPAVQERKVGHLPGIKGAGPALEARPDSRASTGLRPVTHNQIDDPHAARQQGAWVVAASGQQMLKLLD